MENRLPYNRRKGAKGGSESTMAPVHFYFHLSKTGVCSINSEKTWLLQSPKVQSEENEDQLLALAASQAAMVAFQAASEGRWKTL